MDDQRFWLVVLVLSVSSLGLAILQQTHRPLWVALSVVCHAELVAIGLHLARTRQR